jgi:subtilisin family serine protease
MGRNLHLPRIALVAITLSALTCASTIILPVDWSHAGKTVLQTRETKLETEVFQGAEVAAKQMLFKLERCDGYDPKDFVAQLTPRIREVVKDNDASVRQVGNACWFLVKSQLKSANSLFDPLKSQIQITLNLDSTHETYKFVTVEPNFIIRLSPSLSKSKKAFTGSPNDDLFKTGLLWGLDNREHVGIDVNALPAWKFSKGAAGIAVGVIDSGFDYEHPDLKRNIWSAPEDYEIEVGDETFSCPKGSHGYNFAAFTEDKVCDPLDADGNRGHGTHVSGIIGAVGDNKIGVVGVNWTTNLIALKIVGVLGGAPVSDAVKAIDFAIQLRIKFGPKAKIRVLNASWGYRGRPGALDPDSKMLRDAIERADYSNMLFVTSAGESECDEAHGKCDNDVTPIYPSNLDLENLVSVTAIDQEGKLANIIDNVFARFGKTTVHLAAPGTEIWSTFPRSPGPFYAPNSGTSMATPFVSGTAALILSVPSCSKLSASRLKQAIIRGSLSTTATVNTVSGGRLDIYNSIKRCNEP